MITVADLVAVICTTRHGRDILDRWITDQHGLDPRAKLHTGGPLNVNLELCGIFGDWHMVDSPEGVLRILVPSEVAV